MVTVKVETDSTPLEESEEKDVASVLIVKEVEVASVVVKVRVGIEMVEDEEVAGGVGSGKELDELDGSVVDAIDDDDSVVELAELISVEEDSVVELAGLDSVEEDSVTELDSVDDKLEGEDDDDEDSVVVLADIDDSIEELELKVDEEDDSVDDTEVGISDVLEIVLDEILVDVSEEIVCPDPDVEGVTVDSVVALELEDSVTEVDTSVEDERLPELDDSVEKEAELDDSVEDEAVLDSSVEEAVLDDPVEDEAELDSSVEETVLETDVEEGDAESVVLTLEDDSEVDEELSELEAEDELSVLDDDSNVDVTVVMVTTVDTEELVSVGDGVLVERLLDDVSGG